MTQKFFAHGMSKKRPSATLTHIALTAALTTKARRRPKRREQALHFAVAGFLTLALPPDAFFTTVGHGAYLGKFRKAIGAILKRMGVKPGVPDILVLYQNRSMFIELKRDADRVSGTRKGTLSDDQEDTIHSINRAGGLTAVCHSIEEVEASLRGWDVPLRVSAALKVVPAFTKEDIRIARPASPMQHLGVRS